MRTVAFFNNKGGVGKTSLVYHLAQMYADRGVKVTAVDLDPQANLTSMCLNACGIRLSVPETEERGTPQSQRRTRFHARRTSTCKIATCLLVYQ